MNMQQVQSSQIHAIGHNPETNTLAVQFKSKAGPGATYTYQGVPAETHAAMLQAESIGKFFGTEIKGKFEHKKLDEQQAS